MDISPTLVLSMENGLEDSSIKGGLGVLIHDLFIEAYEKNQPFIFVSILYPHKIIQEKISEKEIIEKIDKHKPKNLKDTGIEITLNSNWYPVKLKIWEFPSNKKTKAFFLDPNTEQNVQWLKELILYEEKDKGQELFTRFLLCEGSFELIKIFDIQINLLHLHESDTALAVRQAIHMPNKINIVFHIHTPLPHGHKSYPEDLIRSLYGDFPKEFYPGKKDGFLHLTNLASFYANKIFTVSKIHEDIEKSRLPQYKNKIYSISNAVNKKWINIYLRNLLDKKVPGWNHDSSLLKKVPEIINDEELNYVLNETKKELQEKFQYWYNNNEVLSNFSNIPSNSKIFTFARRITDYKRPLELLRRIINFDSNSVFIFSGPLIREYGKIFIEEFFNILKGNYHKVAYILNYNEDKARYLTAGSDFWINIPVSLAEASGTSHMKAVVNGRILISTPAGTVPEYIIHGYNGFIVRDDLEDLTDSLILCKNLSEREYLQISKNSIASSYYILMDRYINELIKHYQTFFKI